MSDEARLTASLTGVREVVETFRYHGVKLPAWSETLGFAVTVLSSTFPQISTAAADDMVRELRQLLERGLGGSPELLDHLAAQTEQLLDSTRPAGIPSPDDDDWSFREDWVFRDATSASS